MGEKYVVIKGAIKNEKLTHEQIVELQKEYAKEKEKKEPKKENKKKK